MEELIDEVQHQGNLIRIHKDVIANHDETITKMGPLTPAYIKIDKKDHIQDVQKIINKTIEIIESYQDFEMLIPFEVDIYVSKLINLTEIDVNNISTPDIQQVYHLFYELVKVLRSTSTRGISNNLPIKILFMAAVADDRVRLQSEFDDVVSQLKSHIDDRYINFLLPTWNTDYGKLLSRLADDQPNVLHYSGHGDKEGIYLVNNRNQSTQLIPNEYLDDIFENCTSFLQLVFLNSCFSSNQASIISKHGPFVLGIDDITIENSIAIELSKCFYLGFSSQHVPISIVRAIKRGCRNFALSYPQHKSDISLWKDGKRIDYNQI